MEISLGERITFSSEGPAFRVIVIEKDSPQEVMKELGELTGTIELPPLWSLGFHQCRYSYYPDERVKSLADTMRLKNIPCDVIWMDIDYMQNFKIFTFERNPNFCSELLLHLFSPLWLSLHKTQSYICIHIARRENSNQKSCFFLYQSNLSLPI